MIFKGAKVWSGLEINDTEIKALEVSQKRNGLKLSKWGKLPLPPGAVQDGMIVDEERVGRALAELWRVTGLTGKDVIVGLANKGIFVRFAQFPAVPADKLDKMLKFQAQDYLPVALENLVFDYSVTGENVSSDHRTLDILLVGATREMLQPFVEALSIAGLRPIEIEASVLSLLRYMEADGAGGARIYVNYSGGIGNILVSESGVPRLARMVPVGNIPDNEVAGALCANVASSIDYYQSLPGAKNIGRIFISGQDGSLGDLQNDLTNRLGVDVARLDPSNAIKLDCGNAKKFADEAIDYALCMSLAQRGLEE